MLHKYAWQPNQEFEAFQLLDTISFQGRGLTLLTSEGIQESRTDMTQDCRTHEESPGPPPSGVQVISNSMQGLRSPDPVPWRSSCPVWKVTSFDKLLKPKRRFFGSGVVWNTAFGEHKKKALMMQVSCLGKSPGSEIRQSLAIFFWGWWPIAPDSPYRQMLPEDIACTVRNI